MVRYGDLFCQSDWTGDEAVLTILHADQAFTAQLGRSTTHQCWGSVTFWCGSGSATPFFSDFKDAKKSFLLYYFL